jgi:putative membrane-bound dehydrogenase-like protein
LSPRREQATLHLADPGLTIDLAAAEPEVISPVSIAWDADGFLYVAEMIDYPVERPSGRIKRLEDRDGDGIYERSTVFADGLPFPNGVLPCFGGILVTAAPNIWFLKDANGDGKADERRVVLTGFGEGNTQLRVNGLFWGLDNWIYAANGRSDGAVRTPDTPPEKAVSIRRRDVRFRFRPDRKEVLIEAVAGFSQFGLAHDDWGNRFPSWNTIPLRHVVLEQAALDRNPYLAETASVAPILDESDEGRVYPISPVQTRFNRESVDYFNASCGPAVFRGDQLSSSYRGNAFVCEPLTNLVHRRMLEPAGPTFAARRAERNQEFLASTDTAFRPVNLTTGPDGCLYVVDMYRELVEHPDFVPPELRSAVDFRRWHDRGRIWRIRTKTAPAPRQAPERRPQLSQASSRDLVPLLDHPVGWWRDTAQRLLVERGDRGPVPLLEEIARTAKNPLSRLHALWTLAGLGDVDAEVLQQGAKDSDAHLREHALRVAAESKASSKTFPAPELIALAGDASIRVRLQVALLLGDRGREDQRAIEALRQLASRDTDDPWMRLAILSGLGQTALPFLKEWLSSKPALLETPSPSEARLLADAAAILGVRRRDDEILSLLALLSEEGDSKAEHPTRLIGRLALLEGLGGGLERSGSPLHAWLVRAATHLRFDDRFIAPLWPAAQALALSNQPVELRRLGLEALVRGQPNLAGAVIPRLLQPDQPALLRSAAARAVGNRRDTGLAAQVVDSWNGLSLATRRELLGALSSSPVLAVVLVQAIEQKKIAPAELDPANRDMLLRLPDPAVRKRSHAILALSEPADRSTVVVRFQAALQLTGDAGRGAAVFAKNCQTCHRLQGKGHLVGPDLSGIAGRPPSVLLSDILDPNRDVAPDFIALSVATENGQVSSGVLVEETGSTLKLRKAEGIEETILRSQVAEVRSSGRSLMPEGVEQTLSLQDMANLLAFLRSGGLDRTGHSRISGAGRQDP